ncbi:MAG: AAA family ATPase [Alphaproteobacteria bacterium]|nr:AAA family ATPase [Alphaproteobacteria bacterium]
MRLETVSIRNFRLLRRVSVDLARGKTTTVLVGPNNSGKTSVMEALRLFVGTGQGLSDVSKISLHDLSQQRHNDFAWIESRLMHQADPQRRIEIIRRFSPRMRINLTFSYGDDPLDLVAATDLLMDLTPGANRVCLCIEYSLKNAKQLMDDFEIRSRKSQTLIEFLKDSFRNYYGRCYFKVSENGKESVELDDGTLIKRLLRIDVVPAQRHVDDDDNNSRSAKLSRLLHDHYTRFYKVDDVSGYQAIEDALSASATDLTQRYGSAFGRLTTRLKNFGYPQGQTAPDLRVRAEMSAETVYRDNTRIFYANQHINQQGEVEEFELPEKYNGLGYKNLIYIVLQLESFRSALETSIDDHPRVHIIAIEEPEAHLHPQMQTVFISEISKALERDGGTTAQVILSTHSSHIIAYSEFEPVRYFRRVGREVIVRDLSRLPLPTTMSGVLDFLRRYIRLTHCDLFFADKAIFVEGQVERLLLPLMIEGCSKINECADISSQYISISEIGGSYAHKFKPIIDFLGIPTLIITDLDAVDANSEKCPVINGQGTSNACLREWLPNKKTVKELMACNDDDKTQGNIRVAYQVAENGNCGRSFEEAFVYANIPWLTTNHGKLNATGNVVKKAVDAGLLQSAYGLSGKLGKVDFALDLIAEPGWNTPLYIQDGLVWLAKQRLV